MRICDINPFVRYARKSEQGFADNTFIACDHRIFLCIEGNAKFEIKDHIYEITEGDLIFWPSGYEYRVFDNKMSAIAGCNFDFSQEHNHLTIPIKPRQLMLQNEAPLETISFEDTQIFDNAFVLHNALFLKAKFYEIAKEYMNKQIYYQQRCSAILKDILTYLVRLVETSHDGKSVNLAREIIQFIQNHYSEKLTNEDIAAYFNYHPNYLNHLILQNTGFSMHQYLLDYRLNIALELLQSTNLSISQIAENVGFLDIKHFSKHFKNKVGVSPAHYRKQL